METRVNTHTVIIIITLLTAVLFSCSKFKVQLFLVSMLCLTLDLAVWPWVSLLSVETVPFVKDWLWTHPVTLVTEERDHPSFPPLIGLVALHRESELFCVLSLSLSVETVGTPLQTLLILFKTSKWRRHEKLLVPFLVSKTRTRYNIVLRKDWSDHNLDIRLWVGDNRISWNEVNSLDLIC